MGYQRPLIEDVVYEIGPDRVYVHSPGSIFINAKRSEIIQLTAMEGLYKQLVKIARNDRSLKLKGVTKFLPTVCALYPQYCEAVHAMNRLFSELVEIAVTIRADGIHSGCRDDELLEEANEKQYAMRKFCYRNTAYSQFLDYYDLLQQCLRDKPWNEEGVHYTIVLA